MRQCKNPTTFGFFKVPADRYESVGMAMTDFIKDPETNAEILKDFKVEQPSVEKTQAKTVSETQNQTTPAAEPEKPNGKLSAIDESKIDWGDIKQKWGIDKDAIDPKRPSQRCSITVSRSS